jgi:2-polyprenyl-6-methoxyphenol hydroxylase-like FAD-dependent oxidoreductase
VKTSEVKTISTLEREQVFWPFFRLAICQNTRIPDPESVKHSYRSTDTPPFSPLQMGGHYSNIVWSTSESHARALESMSHLEFAFAVNRALTDEHAAQPPSSISSYLPSLPFLGSSTAGGFQLPPRVVEAVGRRASFPLSLVHSGKYVQPRLALVG